MKLYNNDVIISCSLIEYQLQLKLGKMTYIEVFSDFIIVHVFHQMGEARYRYSYEDVSTIDIIKDVMKDYIGGNTNDTKKSD